MTPEQKQALDELIEEFKPEVAKIEAKPKTTQDHYGDYMNLLSQFDKTQRNGCAVILLKAGANYNGVMWAMKILNGNIY